MSIKIETM